MSEEKKKEFDDLVRKQEEREMEAEAAQQEGRESLKAEEALAEETGEKESSPEEEASPEEGSSEKEEAPEAGKKEERAARKRARAEKKDKNKEKIAELEDRIKRQMAEFDNFRKRTEKEKAQMFEIGAKSVIEKILPVIDNFERGLQSVPEGSGGDGFVEGMNMVYKQLLSELENLGVKPIEAVGQEFDPDFHNAVMQVESEEYESGVVAQELQKGYLYRDSVVRHSMVAVVQ